jgi:dTDP-4-dehydrorhamnose 3,5-epimerase
MAVRDESIEANQVIKGKAIDGVQVGELKKIPDERGCIYQMLRSDDKSFVSFGEIYFSIVNPGAIKGWHLHEKMSLNYAVIRGMIKLVLYDDRPASKTRGNLLELFIGDENYCRVTIPPKVWNGFKGISVFPSIVANCSTIPHDPKEIRRIDPFENSIPYDWNLKNG